MGLFQSLLVALLIFLPSSFSVVPAPQDEGVIQLSHLWLCTSQPPVLCALINWKFLCQPLSSTQRNLPTGRDMNLDSNLMLYPFNRTIVAGSPLGLKGLKHGFLGRCAIPGICLLYFKITLFRYVCYEIYNTKLFPSVLYVEFHFLDFNL